MDRLTAAQHTSDLIKNICEEAGRKIDQAFLNNDSIHITKLAKDIATKFSLKNEMVYQVLKFYVSVQTDIKARPGPNGGVVKVENKNTDINIT